ncbi:trypsin-like peptidase domain-containing protein [Patescibacteria group bacterium]|nr:trypsin-like peptidase domain-containing protein [Patescibacteria group bacterium]
MTEKSPIVEVAKKVCPAVITIAISKDLPKIEGFYFFPFWGKEFIIPRIEKKGKEKVKIGGGSGFIVSPDGLILTCRHVISEPKVDYTVILEPEKKYPAQVLASDPLNDVAILKIKDKNLPYLELGDSGKIELGQTVIAIGNPLGEFHDTLSAGIISGLSRKIKAVGPLTHRVENLRGLIQTDAAINPGNSGGPLADIEGKVIGINTAMVMGAQNIGFAIPINYVKKILEQVKKYGKIKIPFLGIRYIILDKEIATKNKLPVNYGALIVRETLGEPPVIKGSAADQAALKEFDIILEFEKEKITTENSLANILQKFDIGDEVNLKILRERKEIMLRIKLGERR